MWWHKCNSGSCSNSHLLPGLSLMSEECAGGDAGLEEGKRFTVRAGQTGRFREPDLKEQKKGCLNGQSEADFKRSLSLFVHRPPGFVCPPSASIWMQGLHNMRSDWLLPSMITALASMDASQWIRREYWKVAVSADGVSGWVLSLSHGAALTSTFKMNTVTAKWG